MNRRSFLLLLESISAGSLAAAEPAASAPEKSAKKKRVIVIGAGLSGLAGARLLQAQGHEVLLIEGRDRDGGRIHTSHTWGDFPLDHGASWIHGAKGNPITRIAREINARMLPTSYDDAIGYHADGKEFTEADEAEIEALGKRVIAMIRKAQDADGDRSLHDALTPLIGPGTSEYTARLVRFILSSEAEQEYGGSISELSTHWFDSGKSFSGGDQLFADGFEVIVNHLAKGLDILHGQSVRSIDWTTPVIRVTTPVREYTADHVLVTLPLGVLKAGDVAMTPALPAVKSQAIARLGMGVLNKCYLRFDKAFWPTDVDWIEYVPEEHGKWSEWVSFMKAANQPVLLGFNAAAQGRAMEKMTDKEVVASAMETLRTIYGADIPEPIGHQITRWAADPFAKGSYSFNALGSTPRMRGTLAKPLQNRLFFAGEATEEKHFGTAHGAYLSGVRAAKEINTAR